MGGDALGWLCGLASSLLGLSLGGALSAAEVRAPTLGTCAHQAADRAESDD